MKSHGRLAQDMRPLSSADLAELRMRLRAQRHQVRSQLATLRDAHDRIGREVAGLLRGGVAECPAPPEVAAPVNLRTRHIDSAEALLHRLLDPGPLPTLQVQGQARTAGISPRTLARARRRLGVRAVRIGGFAGRGTWYCRLP